MEPTVPISSTSDVAMLEKYNIHKEVLSNQQIVLKEYIIIEIIQNTQGPV